MFNWRWKRVLGDTWGIAIDVAVGLVGAGIAFLIGAFISGRVMQHFINATTNNFVQVTASYIQWVSYYFFVSWLLVIGVALAFIGISRFLAHWISQR